MNKDFLEKHILKFISDSKKNKEKFAEHFCFEASGSQRPQSPGFSGLKETAERISGLEEKRV